MAQLVWKKLIGQQHIKEMLGAAFAKDSFGHAYLLCGEEGVGTFQAAVELALALLCERSDGAPCYECDSCHQLLNYNHPDFHCVFPVAVQKEYRSSEGKLNDAGWAYLAEVCREKLAHPYLAIDCAGMPSIPVEWIREINQAILRGAVKGRRNVVCIHGVETLNKESANAMLKTLEEPPADTVILLLTERLHSVLPTLVSRCQILRLGCIPDEVLGEALSREHGLVAGEARLVQALAEAGGSYAKATAVLSQPQDHYLEKAMALWRLCIANDWQAIGPALDRLVEDDLGYGRDYFGAERVLTGLIQIARLCFLRKVDAGGKYISSAALPPDLPLPGLDPSTAGALMAACQQSISAVRGWGNIQMILVTLLFTITELLHGKEQQSG